MSKGRRGGDAGIVADESCRAGVDGGWGDAGEWGEARTGIKGSVDIKVGRVARAVARIEPARVQHAIRIDGDGGEEFLAGPCIDGHRQGEGRRASTATACAEGEIDFCVASGLSGVLEIDLTSGSNGKRREAVSAVVGAKGNLLEGRSDLDRREKGTGCRRAELKYCQRVLLLGSNTS